MDRIEKIISKLPSDAIEELKECFRGGRPADGVLYLRHHFQIGLNDGMMVMTSDFICSGLSLPEIETYFHGDSVEQVAQYLKEQPVRCALLLLETETDTFYKNSWVSGEFFSSNSSVSKLLYQGYGRGKYKTAKEFCVALSIELGIPWLEEDL